MCELLGMSANVPTDICFSFAGLMQRGGLTGPHKDGWGIAFYEGQGCRTFHDPSPSYCSKIADLIAHYPIKSINILGHIRQANVGPVCLENTQPYQRELWGKPWCFAHNGQIPEVMNYPLGRFTPIGSTDSEHAFCWLLDQIHQTFPVRPSNILDIKPLLKACCDKLSTLGVYNMMLADPEYHFAYCSTKLCWITRRAPFGQASLKDADLQIDFKQETSPSDVVTVIATAPLTEDESWTHLDKGELLVVKRGEICH